MRSGLLVALILLGSVPIVAGSDLTESQTDWSGGAGVAGPVLGWDARFDAEQGVSWMAVPGQIALASTPRFNPAGDDLSGSAYGAIKVHGADVDLDGDTDVLGTAYYGDELVLFINDGGNPPGWNRQVIDGGFAQALAVAVVDVDGDGLPDILGGSDAGAEVAWWRNLGGSPPEWSRQTVDDDVPGAHDVASADLDGDADTDILGVSYADDEILWWRNDGGDPIGWQRLVIASNFDYPTKISVADVDRDGDLDLFGVGWYAQEVSWWRNEGGDPIGWTREVIEEGFVGAHWVHAADIDGDGWTDVAGAAMDLRQIAWWRNPGAGPSSWQKFTVTNSLAGAVSTHAADIDGDGDLDLAGAGWSDAGGVVWYENTNGRGTVWRPHIVDHLYDSASSVHVADVDGNGAVDILGSSFVLDQYSWWRVTDFLTEGALVGSILDTDGTLAWVDCGWQDDLPPGTNLRVEARASDDPQFLGPWLPLSPGAACGELSTGARFLQYRVFLESGDPSASPILEDIWFSWAPRVSPSPRRPTRRVTP